jgi:altronate hydrolase
MSAGHDQADVASGQFREAKPVACPRGLVHTMAVGRRAEERRVTMLIRLSEQDNVAVAARSIGKGAALEIDGQRLEAKDPIPFAHKVALRPIGPGEQVVKYGVPIGRAKVAIEAGRHVHVHNIRSDYVNNEVDFFEEAAAEGERA